MSSRSNKAIEDLDLQIQRLKEKRQKLKEKSEKEIGQFVMKEWGIEDPASAKEIIKGLTKQAQNLLNSPTDNSIDKPLNKTTNESSSNEKVEIHNG